MLLNKAKQSHISRCCFAHTSYIILYYYTILYYTILYYTILYCTVLYYTTLYYIILYLYVCIYIYIHIYAFYDEHEGPHVPGICKLVRWTNVNLSGGLSAEPGPENFHAQKSVRLSRPQD